jgi:hypothetical protein
VCFQQLASKNGYTRGYVPVDKPSKEELAFWDKVLHDHRLGIHRGRRQWLEYGHEDREKDTADDELEEAE